jgi:hypothetical protein
LYKNYYLSICKKILLGKSLSATLKFNFPSGAQYCVHNKFIYNKSLDWWKKLYQVHNKYINDSPWIFERIWPLIWSIEEKSSF